MPSICAAQHGRPPSRTRRSGPSAISTSESCPATGKGFLVQGGKVQLFQPWTLTEMIDKNDRWTVSELQSEMKQLLG